MKEVVVEGHTEEGLIALHIGHGGGNGEGLIVDTWKSYSFNSHFTTATDGWTLTLGDDEITDEIRIAIAPRQRVALTINGKVQCTGYVDKVSTSSSRGGVELTVEGRDALSPAVDGVIDPRILFKPEMKLLDLLRAVFGPFGFSTEDKFLIDNENNLNVMSGRKHKTSKAGRAANENFDKTQAAEIKRLNQTTNTAENRKRLQKAKNKRKVGRVKGLSSYDLHLLKPDSHETAFTFASRVAQRFGLWIWPHAEGDHVIVGKPNFDQPSDYTVTHKRGTGVSGEGNNILSSNCVRDGGTQPSVIFATGAGTGGQNPRDQFTICVVNPMVQTDNTAIFAAYPRTTPMDLDFLGSSYSGNGKDVPVYNATGGAYVDSFARPLFLHDENSKTIEELEGFLKRELALRMHKSFSYTFEVVGHEYKAHDGASVPWAVDTIVTVDDDVCDVHEDLWIISRTFTKSRSGGTKTKVECIRPHTLEF